MAATTHAIRSAETVARQEEVENYAQFQAHMTDRIRDAVRECGGRLGPRVPDAKRAPDRARGDHPGRDIDTRRDQFDRDTREFDAEFRPNEDAQIFFRSERSPRGWRPAEKPFATLVAGRYLLHKTLADALAAAGA